eukprot:NODE_16_length_49026_cov_1.035992.p11 type:complete len:348 gc:universal NODE_16_length_49026_cov_1.035992:19632-20675(+)
MSRYIDIFSNHSHFEKHYKEIQVECKNANIEESTFQQLGLKIAIIMQSIKTSQKIRFCKQFEQFWAEFETQFGSFDKTDVKSVLNALYDSEGRQIFGKYLYYESHADAYFDLMTLNEYKALDEYLDGVPASYLLDCGLDQFLCDIPKKHRIVARSFYKKLCEQSIYVDSIQNIIDLEFKCKSIKKANGKMYELPIDKLGYWITNVLDMSRISYLNLSSCGLVKEDLTYLVNLPAKLDILNIADNNLQIKKDDIEFEILLDLISNVSKLDVSNNPFGYMKRTIDVIRSKGLLYKYIWFNSGQIPSLEEKQGWVRCLREWNYTEDDLVIVYDAHISYSTTLIHLTMRSE